MKKTHISGKTVAVGLLALSLSLPFATASAATVSEDTLTRPVERTGGDLQAGVQRVLNSRLRTSVFDWVEAEIEGPRITLRGAVYFPATLDRIERQIRRVPGVTDVARDVEILPVSAFDDRLRAQAYRLIYGNVAFSQYPALGRLPIHILVNGGRVTLVGTVGSTVESRLAETRIRAATLALDVDNRIRVRRPAKAKRTAVESTFI